MAVSVLECGLNGERKYKGVFHSKSTRLKKYITELLKYLALSELKLKDLEHDIMTSSKL